MAGRAGAAARSVLGAGPAAADLTASLGTVLTGSAGAGFAASSTEGLSAAGSGLARRSACPTGLGLASPGAAPGAIPGATPRAPPGATAGTGTGGAAATGDSTFDTAAGCSSLSDGCEPGKCHEPNCEPTSASNPAAARTANRNVRNPRFRPTSAVAVAGSARPLRRGGGSAAGAGPAIKGAFTSAIVAAFSRPPRGIDFHPLVAPHAFSSDSMNSWQLR